MRAAQQIGILGGVNKGIRLSSSSFPAGSAQNTTIGTLSVAGGTGTYTFTLTDSASSKAQVAGTNGVNLQAGATSASASTFNVTVHADNGAGSTFDKAFSITAWSSVSNSVAPAITGFAVQGVILSVSNGTWSGFPAPAYSFQWKRAGSAITGAAASTYTLQAADVGSAITCTVTASNGFSSASATSSATASVTKTTLSYTPVTSATQGSAYAGATPATTNGTSPYVYSVSGSLPAGLSVNPSTGVISGTPTTVQTVSGIALVVTDANGVTDSSSSFSIAVASSSVPTAVTLAAFPSTSGASAGVQRDIALTTGSPIFAGTYSGGAPTGIQGRVRKVSDNSVVTDWTTLTSATISGGAFSGKLAGVPQGDGYYRDVRCLNATAVTATDTTPFLIGDMIIMYGQSFMVQMSTSSDVSVEAAAAGTTFFDGTNFVAVPGGNGVRKLLNDYRSKVGVPCFAINPAVNATPIANLISTQTPGPATNWLNLVAQVTAAGGDAACTIWFQGSSDANGGTSSAVYVAGVNQLAGDLCSLTGRTRAQMPFVLCGLATTTVVDPTYPTGSWALVQTALLTAAQTLTGVYYSHTSLDLPLADGLHLTAAGNTKVGARFAQTLAYLKGAVTAPASWFMANAAIASATTTTVNLTLGLGTDFTPTSGISGFEVSDNAGSTWNTCTGVRASAASITLTHASIGNNRLLRYLYDKLPDISALVVDNSSLALPLATNGTNYLSFTAAGVAPVVAAVNGYLGFSTTSNAVLLPSSIAAGNLLIVACAAYDQDISTPSGWNALTNTTTAGGLRTAIFWKTAAGTEGASVAITTAAATRMAARSLRITGHKATGTPLEVSTPSSANTASPDPGSVTPSWGSDNDLWIVLNLARSGASTTLVTAYPTGYSSNQAESSVVNALGTAVAVATKTGIASSDDPAAFTLAGARESVAVTIAVRPA